jgi:O-antigen biosynthesis protein
MNAIDTTLMMVTYNRLELTKETLKSLLNADPKPGRNYNFVIVDNGSTDGTVEYLQELEESVRDKENGKGYPYLHRLDVVYLPENKGIAIGRNIALKKADELETKWYCTIDNDVKMPENWLQDCVEIMEKNKGYGAVGVNMEVAPYPLVTRNSCEVQEKPHGNLGTACMVFRKQVHQMLGFFTTEYGKYGEEDADFGMRIRVAGFKMGYVKEMGEHLGADETDENEYREFKNQERLDNLAIFKQNCALYVQRKKPLFIPYKDR